MKKHPISLCLLLGLLLGLLAGLVLQGCGPDPRHVYPAPATDSVGPLRVIYRSNWNERFVPPDDRRRLLIESTTKILAAYESDWSYSVPDGTSLDIYPDWNYVPCGTPNSGGYYEPNLNRASAISGSADELPHLYHELHHLMLWFKYGDADARHSGPTWTRANARNDEIADEIRASRGK